MCIVCILVHLIPIKGNKRLLAVCISLNVFGSLLIIAPFMDGCTKKPKSATNLVNMRRLFLVSLYQYEHILHNTAGSEVNTIQLIFRQVDNLTFTSSSEKW